MRYSNFNSKAQTLGLLLSRYFFKVSVSSRSRLQRLRSRSKMVRKGQYNVVMLSQYNLEKSIRSIYFFDKAFGK